MNLLTVKIKMFLGNIILWGFVWNVSYISYDTIIPYTIDIMDFTIPIVIGILILLKIDSILI